MQHQYHQGRSVKTNGFSNLFQHELALARQLRRCQTLGAAGNPDRIWIRNSIPLEKLGDPQLEAMVEAPNDSRVTMIFLSRRIEMKNLIHNYIFLLASSLMQLKPNSIQSSEECDANHTDH